MPVKNNRDHYVTFCKKITKSVTFYLVFSVLLEYIWKMIIKVIDELRDYSYIKIREKSLLQNIKDSSFIAQFV